MSAGEPDCKKRPRRSGASSPPGHALLAERGPDCRSNPPRYGASVAGSVRRELEPRRHWICRAFRLGAATPTWSPAPTRKKARHLRRALVQAEIHRECRGGRKPRTSRPGRLWLFTHSAEATGGQLGPRKRKAPSWEQGFSVSSPSRVWGARPTQLLTGGRRQCDVRGATMRRSRARFARPLGLRAERD